MSHNVTFAKAINEAFREEMLKDDSIFHIGQDIRFNLRETTKGLSEEFGMDRVMHAPISESSFVNVGIGAAIMGMRPIIEIMYGDFLLLACDSIISEAATWRYVHGQNFKMPIVIRAASAGLGGGAGSYHSKHTESIFFHYPGIKVVYPSTPYDAKGLMKTAIQDENVVLFFEEKELYKNDENIPDEEYFIPFGKGTIRHEGNDATMIAWGHAQIKCLDAVKDLENKGISIELIDPRTLVPLDEKIIIDSVKKTGRLIIVEDDYKKGGIGAEISAIVCERALTYLKSPVVRISAKDVPIPSGKYGEQFIVPSVDEIIEAVRKLLNV